MHQIVFYVAIIWSSILLAVTVYRSVRSPTLVGRMLALDTVTLIVAVILTVFGHWRGSAFFLDAVLILILFAFVGTLAAARYASEDKLFS